MNRELPRSCGELGEIVLARPKGPSDSIMILLESKPTAVLLRPVEILDRLMELSLIAEWIRDGLVRPPLQLQYLEYFDLIAFPSELTEDSAPNRKRPSLAIPARFESPAWTFAL